MAHAFNPNTLEAEVGRSLVSFRSVRVNSWTVRTVTKRNTVSKNQIGKKRERVGISREIRSWFPSEIQSTRL